MEQYRFFPYSWYVDDTETEITCMRIYGLSENNQNVCVKVNNFTPYVYIELPTRIQWDSSKAQLVGNKIDEILGQNKRPLLKSLVMKKKLYGAHMNNGKHRVFPYLFCSFSTRSDAKILGYKLNRPLHVLGLGSLKLKMHEQDADSILQMTCCGNIPTAGWVDFSGKRTIVAEQLTICDHEFEVQWKNMSLCNKDTVAKPKIMGFDIEVNSTNISAMPKAEKIGDKVFQISCVMAREGCLVEEYELYLLTLGDPDQNVVGENVIIQSYETEHDLLIGFTTLIRTENPNIIVGYNILNFDIPYMIARAKTNLCISQFDQQGFHKFAHAKEKTIKWSSSAYKNQEFQFLDAEGRLYVDLLPLVKRDFKMDNYKLKTISTFFLGATKDPLSVKGIFKCYRIGIKTNDEGEYSNKARRAMGVVGKYCVKDSVLVVQLMEKLQIWVGLCEMAKTCNVPIFTLYTQGQQIKVFSQVYKYCMSNNIVVEKDGYVTRDDERYVGAHVFPPIPGVYDKVLPFDFCSLYPTTIIAYNIDYSTLVLDDNIPDSDCHVMEWEDHIGCSCDPKIVRKTKLTTYINNEKEKMKVIRAKRVKTLDKFRKKELTKQIDDLTIGLKPYIKERSDITKSKPKFIMCAKRYYRFLKSPKGVLPTILQNLLDARAHTRSEIKTHKKEIALLRDSDEQKSEEEISDLLGLNAILDKRQLAYKVSANSVSAVTPIPCKLNGQFAYRTIEELSQGNWEFINSEQEVSSPIENLFVWSDYGFTKPKYIMRHQQDSPLVRIITQTGFIDCTGDHSLLTPDGKKVRPVDINVGHALMHYKYPVLYDTPLHPLFTTITKSIVENYVLNSDDNKVAFIYGLFFAKGQCTDDTWVIFNKNLSLLNKAKNILNKYNPGVFIITKILNMQCLKLADPLLIGYLEYKREFYNNRNHKKIPDCVLTAPFNARQSFFMGYCAGNNLKMTLETKSQIGAATLMYLVNSIGYNVNISTNKNGDVFTLNYGIQSQYNIIKYIKHKSKIEQDYVYDIETESHHFAAGIGHMIVHNSMYGAMGVRRGYLPFMPGAMCTTYMGRVSIELVADVIPKKYGGELVYGDSVTGDTPILIRYTNESINIKTIDTLGKTWVSYDEFKAGESNRLDKEQSSIDAEVWCNNKWTKIRRVIRHRTHKRMFRVLTHTGCVDVTEDHSLLKPDLSKVKPTELTIGSELLHSFPQSFDEFDTQVVEGIADTYMHRQNILTQEEAFVWGFFMTDGSSDKYNWEINNQNLDYLERAKLYLEICEPTYSFKILDTTESNGVYKLVPNGKVRLIAQKYNQTLYDKDKHKIVPYPILNADEEIKMMFLEGYYTGNGYKSDPTRIIPKTSLRIDCKGKIGTQGLYLLLKSLGYQVSINSSESKPNIFRLNAGTNDLLKNKIAIKKIIELPCTSTEEFVYDLETDEGIFQAGIGELIVKNTDSNYIHFPHLHTAEESWDYAEHVAEEVSKLFPCPMKLEFEEVIYWRFFILTKKRYMYNSCTRDGIVDNKVGKKGVLLARRDNSQFIRGLYESIIMKVFGRENKEDIIYFILTEFNKLCSNCFTNKDFVVTKSIGGTNGLEVQDFINEKGQKKAKIGDYTVPLLALESVDPVQREHQLNLKNANTPEEYYTRCLPAQVQLAEKMRRRGQRIDAGTRLEYVITEQGGHTAKQYIKVESADYFTAHSDILNIDFMYYLKLCSNPIDQVLSAAFKDENEFVINQYKFRLKRKKMQEELLNLFRPKLIFE